MIGLNFTHVADFDRLPVEVTHVRLWDVGVHWAAIHTGPGVYDWSLLDTLVEKAGNRRLLYTIAGTPRWLAKDPNSPHAAPWLGAGSNSIPSNIDEFAAFVHELATRYAGRISAYEVWNEPQLADFLYPYDTVSLNALAVMTKRAHQAIKAADPHATVLAAPVLPRTSSGGMRKAQRYLQALQRHGWNVDAFSCHIYPEPGGWGPKWGQMLTSTINALSSLRPPTMHLWVTETRFGLLGPVTTDAHVIEGGVHGAFAHAHGRPVYWYGWDRGDLKGADINATSPAWLAIRKEGAA